MLIYAQCWLLKILAYLFLRILVFLTRMSLDYLQFRRPCMIAESIVIVKSFLQMFICRGRFVL